MTIKKELEAAIKKMEEEIARQLKALELMKHALALVDEEPKKSRSSATKTVEPPKAPKDDLAGIIDVFIESLEAYAPFALEDVLYMLQQKGFPDTKEIRRKTSAILSRRIDKSISRAGTRNKFRKLDATNSHSDKEATE